VGTTSSCFFSPILPPNILTSKVRYFCTQCESLQDATHYTELRKLPPVLHFSLLRFVYDVSTMERNKSKHSITFPTTLDMGKFLGSKNDRERCPKNDDDNIYELRGILLHKGTSAYHGHYEAQVNDIEYVYTHPGMVFKFSSLQNWFLVPVQ